MKAIGSIFHVTSGTDSKFMISAEREVGKDHIEKQKQKKERIDFGKEWRLIYQMRLSI